MGLPAANMTGAIMFDRPGDPEGTWWCEPCDEIECLMEQLAEATETAAAAPEAARMATTCYE